MDPTNILHLPNEILLHILRYVSIVDLKTLKKCCRRLEEVAGDKSLWNVDLRQNIITGDQLSYVYYILDQSMIKLAIRGDLEKDKRDTSLSLNFITAVHQRCTQLKELIIEDYYIDDAEFFVNFFPPTIEKLSLKGCVVVPTVLKFPYTLFSTLHSTNPNLKCLVLTGIYWPLSHILSNINALNRLTELRLNNCLRILRFDLDGVEFNTLEVLDLRNTLVQQKQLEMFCRAQTLKHLFLTVPIYLREISHTSVAALRRSLTYREKFCFSFQHHVKQVLKDEGLTNHLIFLEYVLATNEFEHGMQEIKSAFVDYELDFSTLLLNHSFRNLETLEVSYCPFKTREMNFLISWAPKLKYLNIKGTAVTIEDIQHFRSRRPDVNIVSSFDI